MRSKALVLLGGLGFALALVACEQIINLDKFKKCGVEADCGASVDAGDASDDAADASDAFVFPDGVSEASSWARWRMDNTPQEVASGAPDASQTSFDAGVSMELFDNVSGLRWSLQTASLDTVTDAATHCEGAGYRLPTRIEIVTLLDSTQPSAPFITPALSSTVKQFNALWTSSYVRPIKNGTLQFWFLDLTTGDMRASTASNQGVLCVR